MHTFKDCKDRIWNLEVNVQTIEDVKESCNVNLLDMIDPESGLIKEVSTFPPLIGKLLFGALADQVKTKGVDEREFKRSMNGDTLNVATEALLNEILLFCPSHRRRLLQAVLEKNREVEEAGVNLAMGRLENPELKTQALAAMDREVSARIASALENLGPAAPEIQHSEIGSLSSAGLPPDCLDLRVRGPIHGEISADLPPAHGGPTPG